MKNCETCKKWIRPENREGWVSAVSGGTPWDDDHTAEQYKNNYEAHDKTVDESDQKYGICTGIQEGSVQITLMDRTPTLPLAVSVDASNYVAKVFTLPVFGCVLHEEA